MAFGELTTLPKMYFVGINRPTDGQNLVYLWVINNVEGYKSFSVSVKLLFKELLYLSVMFPRQKMSIYMFPTWAFTLSLATTNEV